MEILKPYPYMVEEKDLKVADELGADSIEMLGFYKLFQAEEVVRTYSSAHNNSYWITIFACCRELFSHDWVGKANVELLKCKIDSQNSYEAVNQKNFLKPRHSREILGENLKLKKANNK